MDSKLSYSLSLGLAVMLFLSILAIPPTYAVGTPEIYLVLSTFSPNLEWNVTAWVKDIPDINATFAYQIRLFFNTSFLECVRAWIPKWDKDWIFSGLTTVSPTPAIDNLDGFGVVGDSILIGDAVSGSGPFPLAVFEFCIKSELEDTPLSYIDINNSDTYLLNDALGKIPSDIKTEGFINHVGSSSTTNQPHSDFDVDSGAIERIPYFAQNGSVDLIVGLNDEVQESYAEMETLVAEYGGEITDTVSMEGKIVAAVVNITLEQAYSFESEVKNTSISEYVEPNLRFKALMVPNDPYWSYQWGPQKIEADWAWNTTPGDPSVLVAVIDTGIDYDHPDLSANYARDEKGNPLGYDWVNNDPYPMDDFGHGTHCAGIIAAVTNNSEGIAGLAQVRIMAEKVLDEYGGGTVDDVANGIINATDYGADIISMSIGDFFGSELVHKAIKYAYDDGVLLVAAAGNEAISCTSFPAYYREVVAVAATDQNDNPWHKSNFGTWVELAAPGVDILSTISKTHAPGVDYPYDSVNGTSMACPHVAGVAALIWSQFANMTRDQVRIHLRSTVDDLDPPGFDIYCGYGRVNAKNAVEETLPGHDLLILNWTRTPYVKMGNVTVNATILNYGASDESNVVVQLWMNGSLCISRSADFLANGNSTTIELSWPASASGVYNVTVYVVPVPGEVDTENNVVWSYVGTELGIIKVPDYYPTIQQAVDTSRPGDAILVSSGTYNEAVHIYEDKDNLSLLGENRETTIINGSRTIWVCYVVQADNFNISGFTLQNSGIGRWGPVHYYAGVYVFRSGGLTIIDNILFNNFKGIYLRRCVRGNITGNKVISSNTDGIVLWQCKGDSVVINNRVESSGYGIGLILDTGVDLVSGNELKGNGYGIDVWNDYAIITLNKIVSSVNHGIQLWGRDIVARGNHIRDNDIGIVANNSLYGDNKLYWNNLINNTCQVLSESKNKWTGYWNVTGNHWSDYNGTDSDGDGRGDTPYKIDVENIDYWPLMAPWLPGDINHDGFVDIRDISTVARAYGTKPRDQKWNPRADLNEDEIINDLDFDIVVPNFGETWQSYWGDC